MSNPGAALSTSTALPDEERPATAGTGRSWIGRLRGSGPAVLIAVGVLIVWYAGAMYSNIPFARQIVAAHASFDRVLSTALNLPRPLVPFPHQVLADFVNALLQPLDSPLGLWVHMGTTGLEAVLGLLAGTLLGILIATTFVHSRPLEAAFLPYVVASQTVPVIALAPIVISMLGITLAAKVVISAYLAFFSVAISMVKGLKSADPLAYELMRSYAANPWQVYWKLRFPVAQPYLFTGLKVGAAASLVGAIIAELPFGSTTGLGSRLLAASTYGQTIAGWSTMLAASVLGLIGFGTIVWVERLVVKQRTTPAGD